MRLATLLILCFLLVSTLAKGQAYNSSFNGASVPSIAGMSYGKVSDIPVNTYSGTGFVNIPLHIVRDGSLQLPISLGYHTAGLPVFTPASTVGLGWNLQAGGIVSRTVQGIPDEDAKGYYHVGSSTTPLGPQDWEINGGPTYDSEPDIFTYAVNDISGKFFLDANHNVVQVPLSDNRIEVVVVGSPNTDNEIEEIIITSPQGVKYHFGGAYCDFSYVAGSPNEQRIGWHLNRMESADGFEGISLIYMPHDYRMKVPSACPVATRYVKNNGSVMNVDNSCGPSNDYTIQYFKSWIPWLINPDSELEQVVFTSSLRSDLLSNSLTTVFPKKIDRISVRDYQFDFSYNYFRASASSSNPDKRLRLQSVQKKSSAVGSTLSEPPHVFTYNGTTYSDGAQFFPAQLDKNIDHWGYYNYNSSSGNDNNILPTIVPNSSVNLNGVSTSFGSAQRNSYGPSMLIGTLKKVTYPTGGSLELGYEANTYQDGLKIQETLTSTPSTTCNAVSPIASRTLSITAPMMASGEIILCLDPYEAPLCSPPRNPFLLFRVKNSGGTVIGTYSFNASVDQCLYLTPADFNMAAGNTYTLELTSGDGLGSFVFDYIASYTNVTCGGLRISQTTLSDGISQGLANDIVNTYHYEDADYAGASSGQLYRIPKYVHAINLYTAIWLENSSIPLSSFNGYHIGYKRVIVRQAGLGETVNEYNTETGIGGSSPFPSPPSQYDVDAGSMISSVVKNNSGNQIASSSIVRNTNDQYVQYGNSSTTGYFHRTNRALTAFNGSTEYPAYLRTPYAIRSNIYRPAQSTQALDGKTDVINLTYSTVTKNYLPHITTVVNSDGKTHTTRSYYTPSHGYTDVRTSFEERNMLHLPYETHYLTDNVWVGGDLIFYAFYDCDGKNPSYSKYTTCPLPPRPRLKQRYKTAYDSNGNLQVTGWNTDSHIDEYTSNGLVKKVRDASWLPVEYSYNAERRLTEVNFNGHVKSYAYDVANGREYLVSSITEVDGTTSSFTHDDLSRLQTVTDDCKNISTTYEYGFNWGGHKISYVSKTTQFPSPDARSVLNQIISLSYYDGLGREIETVERNQGPNNNQDVLHAVEYDQHGRVARSFEPHLRTNNYGNYRFPEQDAGFTWEFTTHSYELSPLSRKASVTPPSWHPTQFSHGANTSTDAVKIDAGSSIYGAGLLSKQVVRDPNGNQLITFTDRIGRKVLSRRSDSADNPSNRLDTYYLYDNKGQLTKVVPPGASPASTDLIYSYRYDNEGREIYKKVPGTEPILFRYNSRDLLGAYQDGELANQSKWYAYNYDDFGREVSQGFYTGSFPTSFNQLTLSESLITSTYGTVPHEKDKLKSVNTKILGTTDWLQTTNYYSTCGLLTQQSGNNPLEPNATIPEVTTYTYDGGDNLVESVYTHRFLGTAKNIKAEHHLDHTGRLKYDYFQVGSGVNKRLSENIYDVKNNLSIKYQGFTGLSGTRNYLQKIDYTYLPNGMLKGINLAGLSGSQQGIPVSGATATPPNPSLPGITNYDDKDLFYLELYRDQVPSVSSSSVPARKNGDFSYVATQIRGRKQMLFGVGYDPYDRMVDARFYERTTTTSTASYSTAYREQVSYDPRGNIKTLVRRGLHQSVNTYTHEQYDNLAYTYPGGSTPSTSDDDNQLLSITDVGGTARGYTDQGGTYLYDDNGNTTRDPSRQIDIEYNHLDLPTKISWYNLGQQRIELSYDASGALLKRKTFNSSNVALETRTYVGGIEYVNDILESVHHAEGRVYFAGGSERYDFALTDHLGNTRLLYTDLGPSPDGIPHVGTEIIQENHYYPFGMKMTGPWQGTVPGTKTAYQYNGIEHINDFGLNVNMATYRTLDPVVGRWWSVDPKAELTKSWTPYNCMGNSPMVHTDPNGDVLPAVLVGALIGAAISGGTTMATNAIAGNNVFQGIGSAMLLGAAGGAIGAGFNGLFTSAFGQSAGTSILSNVASTAATSAAFGQEITLGTLVGSVAGGLVRGGMPGFTGVQGGALANIGAELIHSTGVGAYSGAVGGAISAAVDGRDIGSGFGNGALYGAIGGAVQATLNVAVMGPAYVPERTYGFFEDSKQPVYRSGGLTWLSGRKTGIALGRNLVTHQYKDKLGYENQHLRAHETAHFIQMGANGFGKFYGGTASQYAKYGIDWRNSNNVYNQPTSYEYAANRYADQWFKLWP